MWDNRHWGSTGAQRRPREGMTAVEWFLEESSHESVGG